MSTNERTESIRLFKDTSSLFLGNIYPDPYRNLLRTGSSYLTVLVNDTVICRYPIRYSMDQVAFDKNNRLWVASRGDEFFVLETDPVKQKDYLQLIEKL